jgi:hypothetical protein
MLDEVARVERLVAIEREIARRREARPLDTIQWLPGQLALLESTAKRKLFRAGVQAQGKTTGGAAECLFRADGRHPFKVVPPAPTFQWVACATERQSGIVQRKLWELTPKDEVVPGCYFDPRKGAFVGKYPKLMFRNGSWIEFRTGHGDPTNLASETLHHVWIDEPPENERAYNELQKRVLRKNGDITLTFTPVNRPVDYLKKKCEAGLIEDLHFRLVPEHLRFVGSGRVICLEDGTPCDQVWIDRLIAETSDMEVPVVIHGGWEFRLEGAYFAKVWDPRRMVTALPPKGSYEELLGIDFGDQPGKQIVLYLMVDERGGAKGHPHIHVEDEYVGESGRETNEDDARATLAMLRRHRSRWQDLKGAAADRAHKGGRADQKSANDLARAIARELGMELRALDPPITVAKRGEGRGAGSVMHRWRWLHGQMARGNLTVHPRCKRLIEALPKASPFNDDDWKDPIDGLAYGLDRYTYTTEKRAGPVAAW